MASSREAGTWSEIGDEAEKERSSHERHQSQSSEFCLHSMCDGKSLRSLRQ